jgi:hypothetical protein
MRADQLKKYRKNLEMAINEVLIDSPELNKAIEKIREDGFDVVLMIEATIGFNRCVGESPEEDQEDLELTRQDRSFLKKFRISSE